MDFNALADQFRGDGIAAIALVGSFARGDAGVFSDVDLVRFRDEEGPQGPAKTHLLDRKFVVVSDVTPVQVEGWFTDPESATSTVAGVRSGRALWDPEVRFAAIQRRAEAFVWDAAMQKRADSFAGEQMVGWIEEVHKGLEGLRTNDLGRMLNAKHGLSWGLTNIMRVQRGVLVTGDNGSYPEVADAMGENSTWWRLSREVFGIVEDCPLRDQIISGLHLYVHTAELLDGVISPEHSPLVQETVARIGSALAEE